jgi:hypothetical protein
MDTPQNLGRALAFSALLLFTLCQAVGAGQLSGTVTAADGTTPLQGISVQARFQENAWYATTTDNNGYYSFPNLPAASYRIRFEDNRSASLYKSEWHDDAQDYASATSVTLAESSVVVGLDASLALGGQLIGTITAENGGSAITGVRVDAYQFIVSGSGSYWQNVKYSNTQADGSYIVGGLEDGSYRLRFSDPQGNYAPEYFDNEARFDDADHVIISNAGIVTNDAALADGSRILGAVTEENTGTGLENVIVYAYRNNGSGIWDYINQTTTLADGSYNLGGLYAGTYRIEFVSTGGLHQREYYDDTQEFGSAEDIAVAAATTLTGYDAALAAAGRIDGTVTDASSSGIPNIDIVVYRYDAESSYWVEQTYGYTNYDGSYSVSGLPAGVYRVGARDNSGNYREVYYDNAVNVESAVDVTVTAGLVTTAINMKTYRSHCSATIPMVNNGRNFNTARRMHRGNMLSARSRWEPIESAFLILPELMRANTTVMRTRSKARWMFL